MIESPVDPVLASPTKIVDAINKTYARPARRRRARGRPEEGRRGRVRGPRRGAGRHPRPVRRGADHRLGQLAAVPGGQGAGLGHPHRARREGRRRPLPHRRRAPRGQARATASSCRRSSPASRSWPGSTSPRSACPRTAASGARSPARTSTCVSPPCRRRRGERVTIRLLDRSSVLLGLADIGMADGHLERSCDDLIERPHGILLVTGPTGSGKTTTLYACLSEINSPDVNILTVEDPVEYQLEGISQIQVNPKIDLTFASRAALVPAPRPRRHHGRRDPRPGDRRDRDHRRR